MRAIEVITNLHTDKVEQAREFFQFLGLTPEDAMNQGWVARFSYPDSDACVQVVTRDATAEDSLMTIRVDDADTAYEEALRRGFDIVHPITDEAWGIRRFFVRSPDGHVINVAIHRP